MPNAEAVFSMASAAVLPGWRLLVLLPRWRHTSRLVCAVVIPGLLAVLYAAVIAARWVGAEGGFSSLADVQNLPLAAWALRHVGRLRGSQQTAVVLGLAAVCALTLAVVLRQALAAQPLGPG